MKREFHGAHEDFADENDFYYFLHKCGKNYYLTDSHKDDMTTKRQFHSFAQAV